MTKPDKYTREEDTRFTLRINKNLFARLQDIATNNKRSAAKQIEYLLEQSLNKKEA